MAKLAYIPETLVRPREKPGVYLAIHPADRPLWFETLVKEIRGAQDCVVWFDEEPEEPWDEELHLSDMEEMNLIVFPVTTRFLLQPNRAREAELPHALKQRVPILPILMETGLEELFERCFGDVQYLDRAKIDPTALPYTEKLKTFLASVLVGDELAAQVRAAFDAYIFLSYRKKDRKEAQELMRLIHQNDFCQSVAIWYDEFLVPGENFNGAIEAALRKSHLFALAVTPNLTERPNYVETHEYPKARDAGVPVIPVQMAPTVRADLETAFPGIPRAVDSRNPDSLSEAFLAGLQNIALRTKKGDPRHTYFMGLAYLNGIDVEVDRTRGAELITQAADAGLPEAMGKLVTMYRAGEGVERDYIAAICWKERLANHWEFICKKSGNLEDIFAYLTELWDLGDYWVETKNLKEADRIFRRLREESTSFLEDVDDAYIHRYVGLALTRIGDVTKQQKSQLAAVRYYELALEAYEACLKLRDDLDVKVGLAVCYERLGNAAFRVANLNAARIYYEKVLTLCKTFVGELNVHEFQLFLAGAYNHLADISHSEGNVHESYEFYRNALYILKKMAEETDSIECWRRIRRICIQSASICPKDQLENLNSIHERAIKRIIDIQLADPGNIKYLPSKEDSRKVSRCVKRLDMYLKINTWIGHIGFWIPGLQNRVNTVEKELVKKKMKILIESFL